jgi:hypothetical protein
MPAALSLDLRVRVLAAVAQGLSHRATGERFGVSAASVSPWRALGREQDEARALRWAGTTDRVGDPRHDRGDARPDD